jgi:HEAT repeat protein
MSSFQQQDLLQSVKDALGCPELPEFIQSVETLRDSPKEKLREVLATLLEDPEADLALGIARAIGILSLTEAAQLLVSLVDEPGKWFAQSERVAIRLAAVESLGLVASERGINVLLDTLESTHDEQLAAEVIKALGMIKSPRITGRLLQAMNEHPPLALSAAGALAQIGGEEAFQGLIAGLRHEDEMVRSASVWALGELGDPRAVGTLVEMAINSDAFLRRDIAWSLGRIGGMSARLALGAACQRDPDPGVRREAARAIRSGAVLGAAKNREVKA